VCVVGPAGAGKTALCKLLAGRAVPETRTHDPTEGVRIEEVERDIDGKTVSVQLWDCSGDLAYETSHPAMRLGLDALVLVRDAEDPAGDGALERWHDTFAFGGGTDDGLAVGEKAVGARREDERRERRERVSAERRVGWRSGRARVARAKG
jgi:GTPase SAR1 family protein